MKLSLTSGLLCLPLVMGVAACSSGSDASGEVAQIANLVDRSQAATAITDAEDLSGIATMTGVIAVDTSAAEGGIVGDMSVVADFGAGSMTGEATNLVEVSVFASCLTAPGCTFDGVEIEQELGGSLDLDADITDVNFEGTLTGTLTGTADTDVGVGGLEAIVDLDVNGGFSQDGSGLLADADLTGDTDLTITVDDQVFTETESVSGVFIVAE